MMTVTEIMLNFRDALAAAASFAERAGIPWQADEAYDQWDDLSDCLYRQLVCEALAIRLDDAEEHVWRFSPYDLLVQDYTGLSTIEVRHPCSHSKRWVFHSFGTRISPFDIVLARAVTELGRASDDKLHTCEIKSAEFSLRHPDLGSIETLPLRP